MSQGPLCPNLTQKFQKEVSQIANRNFPIMILLGGLSVNLNHLKTLENWGVKQLTHSEPLCSLNSMPSLANARSGH